MVESESKYYVLIDKNNIGSINGWSSTILGSGSSGGEGGTLPSVMIFRDSLETYAQLEAIPNPKQGDVYSVYNDPDPNKNARLYVRIENYGGEFGVNVWKDLGVSVDLSDYVKSDDLLKYLADYVTTESLDNTLNGYIRTSHPANTVTDINIASWNNKVDKPSAPNNVNTKVILADGTTKDISEIKGITDVTTDYTLIGNGSKENPLGLSEDIKDEIEGIQTSVDNIKVGGRNLILNSKINATVNNNEAKFIFWSELSENLEVGKTYIFQGFNKTSNFPELFLSDAVNNYDNGQVITEGVPFVAQFASKSIRSYHRAGGGNFYVKAIKLEKGNKPTDWTPAPEDIKDEIAGKISKQGINLGDSGNIPEMKTGDISGIYRGHGASNAVYDLSPFFQMVTADTFAQVHINYVNGEMAYRAGNTANGYSPIRKSWDTGNLVNPATQTWVNQQKGIANGLATLNDYGVVPPSQLPSYLDEGLKSVKAGTGIIVNNNDPKNPIISVDSKLLNVLTEEFIVTSGAGSFRPGDSFPGNLTLAGAFKALLTDVFEPTFPIPVGYSLSNNGMSGSTPLWEVGSSQNLRLTSSFNRGQIKGNYHDGEWFPDEINPRAGLPSSHIVDGTTYTTTDTVQVKNIPIVVPATSTTYYSTVNYGIGIQPKDSEGKDFDLPYSGGNMSASTSIVGGLNTYAGPINSLPTTGSQIRTALLNTSVLNRPNKFDYTMSTTTPFYVIATPVGRVLGSVITANNENQTSLFKKSSTILTVPDAAGTNRDYNVYMADLGDPFTSAITVTITLKNG